MGPNVWAWTRRLVIGSKVGNFLPGKEFDALVCDTEGIDLFDHDDSVTTFQKFVYLGDNRNIRKVFVSGSLVLDKKTDRG